MSTSSDREAYRVNVVHNALFMRTLERNITALSLPLTESNSGNLARNYITNNKPTQIEGI